MTFDPTSIEVYVWLSPRITVSKYQGNAMYVDTVINFAQLTTYMFLHPDMLHMHMYRPSDHSVQAKQKVHLFA